LQNECLAAENRILKTRLQPGWRLSEGERATLAEIGRRFSPGWPRHHSGDRGSGGPLRLRELRRGYDRVVGAWANLGHQVSAQTVGNILCRHGIGPGAAAEQNDHLEELYSPAYGCSSLRGLLHRRSADLARLSSSTWRVAGLDRWNHRSSGGVLDASGSLQRDI